VGSAAFASSLASGAGCKSSCFLGGGGAVSPFPSFGADAADEGFGIAEFSSCVDESMQ
jgi:hypothetical protein